MLLILVILGIPFLVIYLDSRQQEVSLLTYMTNNLTGVEVCFTILFELVVLITYLLI